jgi:hypothetical protein
MYNVNPILHKWFRDGSSTIQRGGGLPVVGWWGSLMTHSAGSVTNESMAI